ncbi:MAG TPA: family 14 glycosylhydrolase [Armatimonadota bacterium]
MRPIVTLMTLAALALPAQAKVIASWRVTEFGVQERGLKLLSGADGETELIGKGGSRCATTRAGSAFLYFQATPEAASLRGPAYLTVEFYDGSPSGGPTAHYNSDAGTETADRYRPSEDAAGASALGLLKWRTASLKLERPRFQRLQNLSADFRLAGMPLFVRSLRLDDARPANWAKLGRLTAADLKPLAKIGAGGELIVGGWDPTTRADAAGSANAFAANAPALKRLGVTSHESYVRWNLCETAPGAYDWSVYDRYVATYRKTGLKWVPFLIVGPPYAIPNWYYNSPARQGYVCLEHGETSDVESLWNPAMRGHVSRFIRAFAEHYRESGVIESLLLGITGNYGEAIYVATPNQDWTNQTHGPYHSHPGFWAGDKYAVDSFQQAMRAKYKTIAALNAVWKTAYAGFEDVKPFIPAKSSLPDRAKLDFTGWYIGSMNDWARFWMTETRAAFPKAEIYLCTGGHAPPEHGSDFGEQCKIAASVQGGVRITNEASNYALNFALTRWVASAARQYGAYFSFEPAGGVSEKGVVARVYNAAASGAKGLHYYSDNILRTEGATGVWLKNAAFFQQRRPLTEVGVYYPETDIQLHGARFLDAAEAVRPRMDFAFISDGQISDGGLNGVKALFLLQGTVAEQGTWQRIADWVRAGGLLIAPAGLAPLTAVEGEPAALTPLLSPGAETGKGRVLLFNGPPDSEEYRAFLSASLAAAPELSPSTRAAIAKSAEDGLFRTVFPNGKILSYDAEAGVIR